MALRWTTALLLAAVAAPAAAAEKEIDDTLRRVEDHSSRVASRYESLEAKLQPQQGFLTQDKAMQRYSDGVYAAMLGEHEEAAENFFALVTTGVLAGTGLHSDAEWYLAESLRQIGNTESALTLYESMSQDEDHPFREDAVRRLLEILATMGDEPRFEQVYNREIRDRRVEPSDLIVYAVGKSFYLKGDYAMARVNLLELASGSEYYGRGRYILGAMLVEDGGEANLEDALAYFDEVAALSIETEDARQVSDQAILAAARIHYELGEFDAAIETYGMVGGDSEYLADKLFEIVWTFIKKEDYQQALRAVEIFLLAFPEHPYSARLKLLEGHLHYREVEYDSALVSYKGVVAAYSPVRDRFAELADSPDAAIDFFGAVNTAGAESPDSSVPTYAVAMLRDDHEVSQAVRVYDDLVEQAELVADSEALVTELQVAIGADPSLGGFATMRYDAVLTESLALGVQLEVLRTQLDLARETKGSTVSVLDRAESELKILKEQVDSNASDARRVGELIEGEGERLRSLQDTMNGLRTELVGLEDQAKALRVDATVAGEKSEELVSIEARIDEIKTELAETRGGSTLEENLAGLEQEFKADIGGFRSKANQIHSDLSGQLSAPEEGSPEFRLQAVWEQTDTVLTGLEQVHGKLEGDENVELDRVRQRFLAEVEEVARQRGELSETFVVAKDLAVQITRVGFRRLESFFAGSVVRADVGVVDVYWSQVVEVSEQRGAVLTEKNRLVKELDDRFEYLRQKMAQ